MNRELKGKILTKHNTLADCAQVSKISKGRLYRIISETTEPTPTEIAKIAHACGEKPSTILEIFLSGKTTYVDIAQ